jgi:hypothetical protein
MYFLLKNTLYRTTKYTIILRGRYNIKLSIKDEEILIYTLYFIRAQFILENNVKEW